MLTEDLAAALDPVIFARRLGFLPDPWQVQTLRFAGKRMLLNCSRQAGKSTTTAILAAHRVVYCPNSLVLLVSPSLRQSSELFKKVTGFLDQINPTPRKVENNRLSIVLENGARVVSLPSSEATIRGFSAVDLIIEDEASRVDDAIYKAMRPMLAISSGSLILMSTPYGKRGHFFEEWANGDPTWQRLEIPATSCPRISMEFLSQERRSLGDLWFEQEYLCQFKDTVNQVFSYDLVTSAISTSVRPLFGG